MTRRLFEAIGINTAWAVSPYRHVSALAWLALLLLPAALLVSARSVLAADSGSAVISFTNQRKVQLTLNTNVVNFGPVDPGSEVQLVGALVATVKSNTPWVLTATPQSNLRSAAGSEVPIGQLSWRVGSAPFQPFQLMKPAVLSQGDRTAGTNVAVDFQVLFKWDDPVGDLSTTLVLNAAEQP
jgi:hypothetical protein